MPNAPLRKHPKPELTLQTPQTRKLKPLQNPKRKSSGFRFSHEAQVHRALWHVEEVCQLWVLEVQGCFAPQGLGFSDDLGL